MKYCKHKSLKESLAKKASLRLINDIAVIDVELAAKMQPSIMKFVESLDSSTINKNDLLNQLTEFFKIPETDKTARKAWLDKNKTVTDAVNQIMNKDQVNEEDVEPGLDTNSPEDAPGLDTDKEPSADDVAALVPPKTETEPESQALLDKMQLETRIRAFIETKLTEFLANSVNASTIAANVDGYKVNYATNGYDDTIDSAFDRVLNVLIDMLMGNY